MRFATALLLAALTGFTALSLEICWSRLYSFLSATRAYAFAAMLCSYLLGLALGSLWSIRFQNSLEPGDGEARRAGVARLVLLANGAGFLLTPVVGWVSLIVPYGFTYPLVVLVSGLLGTLLPLICHFSVPPDARVGSRLSKIYLANIAGSGAGSLLTGFVLMEYVPMRWIAVILLAVSAATYVMLHPAGPVRRRALSLGVCVVAAGAALTPALYWQFWERIQKDPSWAWDSAKPFAEVVESRSGVITVSQDDVIYGGGAYDGVIKVKPSENSWLVRAYALSAMHADPQDVLMVGMSGGSWAQIVAHLPRVKKLTVIEINHAYTGVIGRHPVVRSLLANPKVEIIIDDGRRWLERHPERKFDAILMNSTHHWREFSTNLLSTEFLTMAAKRLKPHGIFQYNATDSPRVARTALDAFPNVMLLLNNIVISPDPIHWDTARWKGVLENYQIDGKPVFDPASTADRAELAHMLLLGDTLGKEPAETALLGPYFHEHPSYRLHSRAQLEKFSAGAAPITDDNLGHEYRWW